jgi:hypothetical protein
MFKITNGNEFKFKARFDGMEFVFPPGEAVMCQDEAAQHIFGIAERDKTPVLARHGWVKPMAPLDDGMAILNRFKFEHVEQRFDAPLAQGYDDHGPAPVIQNPAAGAAVADEASKPAAGVEDDLPPDFFKNRGRGGIRPAA